MPPAVIRIAIVAPSPLQASGLAAALAGVPEWQVAIQDQPPRAGHDAAAVLQARDAAQALALHAALPGALPAVMLGDELRELAQQPATRALALLSPQATPAQLRAAVAAVLQGLAVREPAEPWAPFGEAPALDHEPLTPRELEVFELIGKGLSNRDIAGVLGISAHTAKYHVGQILAKVGAATRAEAVSAGLRMGIIGL
jgi:ATP/maltotriose-dependent transcriptional regulator MalT